MSGPFDAAIAWLKQAEAVIPWDADLYQSAIRVLEAAGKVDSDAAILDMNMAADFYEGPDVPWFGWESVRSLLAALPATRQVELNGGNVGQKETK